MALGALPLTVILVERTTLTRGRVQNLNTDVWIVPAATIAEASEQATLARDELHDGEPAQVGHSLGRRMPAGPPPERFMNAVELFELHHAESPRPATAIWLPESAAREAPFEVRVPNRGGTDYYIRLERTNGSGVYAGYIRAGEAIDTEIPLGSYRLQYATGTKWYGTEDLFGPQTNYFEAEAVLRFERTTQGTSGWTVELIEQVGGNLSTGEISPEEFLRQ
ncbi:MAG: hypothetical protein KAU31_01520 [Spirochaetaceae bacterium]|nr:hypothetical protein [Spirochaetaceae bacterium]